MPLPLLPSLLSLRLHDSSWGHRWGQFVTVCDGLDFQSNIYNTLFISLPLGKRSGFWLNSMSGSRRNKVRLGLQAPWATACFERNGTSGRSSLSL